MTATSRLSRLVAELEQDRSLYVPEKWRKRMNALDRLESCLIHDDVGTDKGMLDRASKAAADLEAANRQFYDSLRRDIQAGRGAQPLMRCAEELDHDDKDIHSAGSESYDDLDVLISGVLRFEEPGEPVAELASEMVFYQPTPARHIFDFIRRARLDEQDVLVDLGAGLGHVPILAAICSSAQCIGVECEPVYVASAKKSASDLRLDNVVFLEQDVRASDLSRATVFYLYTPFTGTLLRDVLDMLAHQAALRDIRVGTLGPCTAVVAKESWLQTTDILMPHKIVMFRSM
jgi:predicted RNA methylase